MRKQELVQMHALCVLIRDHFEEEHGVPTDVFHDYDEYGVTPAAIHRRKDIHKNALFRLLVGFSEVFDNPKEDQLIDAIEN